jgi:hypothetical protein
LSTTVTLNVHVLFPFGLLAVYDTSVVPTGNTDPGLWLATIPVPEQLFAAAGAVQLTAAPHKPGLAETVMLPGHDVKTGGVLSVTVTLNEQVEVFPLTSVAVYITCVVPSAKTEPDARLLTKLAIPQLSEAVGAVHVTVAPHGGGPEATDILEGQPVIWGGVLSVTVTLNEHVEVLL